MILYNKNKPLNDLFIFNFLRMFQIMRTHNLNHTNLSQQKTPI